MKSMKKIIGLALMASAAATTANAEPTFSGNVALTSDYVFRGVSQSDSEIAIQGGFDVTNDIFYAGAWASSIDFGPAASGTVEVDVYGGVRPVLGPVTLDFGVIGYLYPGMDEAAGAPETDMWEFKAGASITPAEGFTLGGALYYSPDFTLTTGDESGLYAEINAAFTVSDVISISGAFGSQDVDQAGYYGAAGDSYTTWNIGGTASVAGFGLDLRYTDTDLDPELFGPSGDEVSDGRVVFTVKRAL
jgi:uncharacterized protein (TIGR02001 family)